MYSNDIDKDMKRYTITNNAEYLNELRWVQTQNPAFSRWQLDWRSPPRKREMKRAVTSASIQDTGPGSWTTECGRKKQMTLGSRTYILVVTPTFSGGVYVFRGVLIATVYSRYMTSTLIHWRKHSGDIPNILDVNQSHALFLPAIQFVENNSDESWVRIDTTLSNTASSTEQGRE